METLLEYLISASIISFGVWIILAAAKTGSDISSVLILLGLLPIAVGSISFYGVIKNGTLKA
jgi:hypothetical protein